MVMEKSFDGIDILLIVSDLASGIMKSEKALELISNEAQKRMRIGPL